MLLQNFFRQGKRDLKMMHFLRIDVMFFLLALSLLSWHIAQQPETLKSLIPQRVHNLSFTAHFEPGDNEVNLHTYLPDNNSRQTLLDEDISNQLSWSTEKNDTGRKIHWSGEQQASSAHYRFALLTKAVRYHIDPQLLPPAEYEESLLPYLLANDVIQVRHPEIMALWQEIKPGEQYNIKATLQAIHQYTYRSLQATSFKGTTDALTALRLGIASCNGKSRLFVALARLNNIPARLVGGIILEPGSKRTSHQWVEVYIENHWIPFDPTNGYFAELPAHYVQLYTGDQALIRHTSNINFEYQFQVSAENMPLAFYKELSDGAESQINLHTLLRSLNLSTEIISIILLFPMCTLVITFLHNVIGVKTFGIFMPMLISASCIFSGFLKGLACFAVLLFAAWLVHMLLSHMRLLKTARLAIVITFITILFITGLSLVGAELQMELGILSAFPIIVISFIAESIHQATSERKWAECLHTGLGTLLMICCCYITMNSVLLQGIFSVYPETYLLVLAGLIFIGSWCGLRVTELRRFREILKKDTATVLGINARNRDFVYKHNDKKYLLLATNKLESKKALAGRNIPTPDTLAVFEQLSDITQLSRIINNLDSFVIKPNSGSQGKGIVVIHGREQKNHISANGNNWPIKKLESHLKDIISGAFSQDGESDIAYIEPVIKQHDFLQNISCHGLSDIRIIVGKGKVVSAMLRIPTRLSSGKANLHQGALGVAIDINNGISRRAQINGKTIKSHPDSKAALIGLQIPYWTNILKIATNCYKAIPLGYMGVDICLDAKQGPLVLEVNGRSGLEIQNVQKHGLHYELLNTIEAC